MVDSNSAIIDLFTIMSQEQTLEPVISHPQYLPNLVDKFIDSAARFKRDIFRIVSEARQEIPAQSPSLQQDFEKLAHSMEASTRRKQFLRSEYPEYKQNLIDFLMITNPDSRFLSYEKSAQKILIDR